jgi:hypothetical protein
MKLYTEEQVREAIELAREGIRIYGVDEFETEKEFDHSEDDIITSLTPIESPSDDEIEEAAKIYANIPSHKDIDEEERYYNSNIKSYDAFIDGAKWQAKRMYSKEEVLTILYFRSMYQDHFESNDEIKEWFDKFKK